MKLEPIIWVVPADAPQSRLDSYLTSLLPHHSRSQIQLWIRNGHVAVNGRRVKTGFTIGKGDAITLEPPSAPPPNQPVPEDLPLEIVYRDEVLAVVVKPAGMVCHAGAGVVTGTLVNALLHHLGPIQAEDPLRPGIVHRLDKQTSGLIVAARNPEAHRILGLQFKNREVRKEYLAVVYGSLEPPQGTIDRPLGRDPADRKKFSVRARRRRTALTRYSLERSCGPFSLVRVQIATGRTHQIRVHMASLGHPLVGDELYGAGWSKRLGDARLRTRVSGLHRHLLHACHLEFRHPVTGQSLAFTSHMPPEMKDFLDDVASCSSLDGPGRRFYNPSG